MAFRADVSIDWLASPRLITVAAPSTSITAQDLSDTLRKKEWCITGLSNPLILESEGKFDLRDGVKLTGISLRMVNAQIAFEARPGPTWAECQIEGGNITAVDDAGDYLYPIHFTPYTSVAFESDISAALIAGSGGALTPSQETELTTAATQSTAAASSAATAASEAADAAADAALARKVTTNRATVLDNGDDTETVTIYDDDDLTPLYVFTIDKTGNPITKVAV
jgi:hypothetical protein